MTANKTAATPENGKEKKPRGRKPRTAKAKSEITTGAGARLTDPEGQAILSTLAALRNLDNEARLRVMGYVGQRYGVNQGIGNTEQRSMAAGA